ncbi:asparagine synthase (glutamine-hydrolyzing) [Flagellimonas onchidii]|uniref:asparagine synthase (glutamine-hydrolyzing) n=1 Tax=Flagellimonas onchidii TaxID=2562684 RepID=UPI0010A6797A|nr:asparagine synthase (glutamine-hydrolyzing) [Allomuricauda onchidii]
MCGIYGTTLRYKKEEVAAKLKRTDFRGPDFSGVQNYNTGSGQLTFGHNRLAILDLDARSNQPFTFADQIHVVFNGEIYNFLEIKETLSKKGHQFKTTSDTEVICAAYLEYGEDCVKHFNGMFAFVLYDHKNQILFGARDRTGQKPFYYMLQDGEFEFASQVSAIELFNRKLTVSQDAISQYMHWGYIPEPFSIYNEVKKLKAGHSFVFNLNTKSFTQKQYWDIDFEGKNKFEGSYEEAKTSLESILESAVKKRMIADVPLGVFLSGGVDSSLIAALASKDYSKKLKTFSVKFDVKSVDESIYAQKVANHLGTDHNTIECKYSEGIDLIKQIGYFYDEPFADSSAIPTMLLSKYTRKHVTVALSGDGGDESFIGYHRYNWVRIAERFYGLPGILRSPILATLKNFPYYRAKIVADVLSSKNIDDAYMNMISGSKDDDITYSGKVPTTSECDSYLFHNNKNIYERVSDFDIKSYLNDDINTKVDRAAMAFSLETRSPFLDHNVIEFGRSIPTEFKFYKKNQKRILKDVLYKYVPKEFFDRPKAGFTMPLKEWFRNELKDYVLDELNTNGLEQIPGVKIEAVQKYIQQHMDGSWNRSGFIWQLLVLKQSLNRINQNQSNNG